MYRLIFGKASAVPAGRHGQHTHPRNELRRVTLYDFTDALRQRLTVMDSTAFSLCLDNNVPILVFDMDAEHAIRRAVQGKKIGTLVHS